MKVESRTADDALAGVVEALDRMRQARPLIQTITNYVSMDIAANALLAIGASPAMVHATEEVEEFVGFSGALVVNIGTLSGPWVDGTPWVLDPVGVGATRFRNDTVARLMQEKPAIVRGNASEILAVANVLGVSASTSKPKGVDSANSTDEAADAAAALAQATGAVVVATGAVDIVADRSRVVRLSNGSPLMAQVTAVGCALSGIVGAFAATTPDPFAAAVAAVGAVGVAGELAARKATLPGSFRVAFIDGLAALDAEAIRSTLRLSAA
jgi:hydroxyethylthiazole kinase